MPPEEELPPYHGHTKSGKRSAGAPPTLSCRQQAAAKRVKVLMDSKHEMEQDTHLKRPMIGSEELTQVLTELGISLDKEYTNSNSSYEDEKAAAVGGVSYGAADAEVPKVINVVNLGHHWGSFFVDMMSRRCFVFDPMKLQRNVSSLTIAVRTVVEPML
ncbi:hypothetical protein PHMEG_00036586, partial [Phytophthora megakarya]